MSNKMKEVANLLGVELEEEFKIKSGCSEICATIDGEKGLMVRCDFNSQFTKPVVITLTDILLGKYEVEKLPFRPKDGDCYWTYFEDNYVIDHHQYWNEATHHARLKCGMVFRNKEEAERERPRIYKELTGKEWRGDD